MTSSPTFRPLTASTLVAGGLVALCLSLAPSVSADPSDGSGVDVGAARNDVGRLRPVDPGAARNDIGSTPEVDVRRLLNDIDDPAVAPRHDAVEAPGTAPATDGGSTADDSNAYVGLAAGALAGIAVGAGATAVVATRRSRSHAAGQTA